MNRLDLFSALVIVFAVAYFLGHIVYHLLTH